MVVKEMRIKNKLVETKVETKVVLFMYDNQIFNSGRFKKVTVQLSEAILDAVAYTAYQHAFRINMRTSASTTKRSITLATLKTQKRYQVDRGFFRVI